MNYLVYLLLFIQFIYIIYSTKRSVHMLQQNLYNENNRYVKWTFKNRKSVFLNLNLYGILFSILLFYSKTKEIDMFFLSVLILVYIVSLYVDRSKRKLEQNKKPLVITSRVKRLLFTIVLLYSIPFIIYFFKNSLRNEMILTIAIMACLNFVIVYIANCINHPVERLIYHKFKRQAQKKLKENPSLKIVGITGSYGKTSSKNVLNDILNV